MTNKKRNIVSVIIPAFNSSLLLKRSIDSVYIQETSFNIELIIVDDGSEDDINQIISHYPDTKFVTQKNSGPAAARNTGLTKSSGEYIAFLDADDYWNPGFLHETVQFLENHPEAIAVSTGQLHKFPQKKDTVIPRFLESDPKKYVTPFMLNDFYDFWTKYQHVCTGSVLMRANIVKKTGGQRPELRITEDLEFWFYFATFGPWGFIPKVLFVSDGSVITKQTGWLKKNQARWASAPSVEEWEKRIINRIPGHLLDSYKKARGDIAKRLVYSMILSNRKVLARQTTKEYKKTFPDDKLSKVLKLASNTTLSWLITCNLIIIKERFRKV